MRGRRLLELVLLIVSSALGFLGLVSVDVAGQGRFVARHLWYPGALLGCFLFLYMVKTLTKPKSDPFLLPIASSLSFIGITALYRLNPRLAGLQLVWAGVGAVTASLLFTFLKDAESLGRYRYTLGILGLALLVSAMVFGKEVNGAKLWISVGPLNFQPSELAKIFLTVFFASYLAEHKELLSQVGTTVMGIRFPRVRDLGPLLAMWAVSLLILIYQKDLGSSLLFFGIFISMLYVATGRLFFVVVGILLFLAGAFFAYQAFPHVKSRIRIWLDPLNPETVSGESYQIAQSLFALAEGGISGKGFARGSPRLIPFAETDFVFAALGEELGIFGAVFVVMMFLLFAARGLFISMGYRGDVGKLLAAGLTTVLFLQSFIIMGGVTRLVPLTGITLPFVSYGGSSLLSNFILLSLLVSVSEGVPEVGE